MTPNDNAELIAYLEAKRERNIRQAIGVAIAAIVIGYLGWAIFNEVHANNEAKAERDREVQIYACLLRGGSEAECEDE